MKELSIEEKAKRYDEAIKIAKSKIKNDKDHVLYEDDVIEIFPELKESEDERIRKDIIVLVNDWWDRVNKDNISTKEQMISWLEKQAEHANFRNKIQIGDKVTRNRDGVLVNLSQLNRVAKKDEKRGEQKPAWSKEDATHYNRILKELNLQKEMPINASVIEEVKSNIIWFKSIKDRVQPKQEWSEEDKKKMDNLIQHLKVAYSDCEWLNYTIVWLKSLRPQNRWKPSNEQMEALANALSLAKNCGEESTFDLRTLYEQLKKLKE